MDAFRSRSASIIVAVAAVLVLAACSSVRLGYGNFPTLAYWWLDGYVDFTPDQAPRARAALDRLHAWHRQQELPWFLDLLAGLEQQVAGPISAAAACTVAADVQERLLRVADFAEPAGLALARGLGPAQLEHLRAKHASNNRDFRAKWLDDGPGAQQEQRFEAVLDRLEMLYGRLGPPQRAVLREALSRSVFDAQRVLAERERRQQDLLHTLEQVRHPATAPEQARALLRGYLARARHAPDPGYRAWQQALREESCRVFEAVHASTDAAQRQRAAQRLRAWRRDLQGLAGPL